MIMANGIGTYVSATDIKLGRMNIIPDGMVRAKTEEQNQHYFDMADQKEHISVVDQDW